MDLSVGSLITSLLVSSLGFGFFLYGKKQARFPQLTFGLLLMTFPYFVSAPFAMCGIAAGLSACLYVSLRAGL